MPENQMPLVWELVEHTKSHVLAGPAAVSRAKVPGGWLMWLDSHHGSGASGVTFIPDPQHLWKP